MLEVKDYIAIALMAALVPFGVIAASASQRTRDVMFFLLILGAVVPDRLDINFFSRYWFYRGTTRGFEISLVDILAFCLLAASVIVPRKGQRRLIWPGSLTLMLLYFTWCAISVATAQPKILGAFELTKVFRSILIFVAAASFVRSERELRILLIALASVVWIEGFLALKQRYVHGIHRVTGSVYHPNSLSMYLCMAAPILMAAGLSRLPAWLRWYSLGGVAVALVGILLTISRAGIPVFLAVVGGATVFSVSWRITGKKIAAGFAGLAAMGLVFFQAWDSIKSRYGEATIEDEMRRGSEGRGHYFRLAKHIVRDHPMGVGLNNWSYVVSKTYGSREGITYYRNYDKLLRGPEPSHVESYFYAPPAHNLAALTAGELGIPGLILFGLVWARWFQMGVVFLFRKDPDPMRRVAIGIFFSAGGVFLQSVTEWTYRQTPIILTFHLLLGVLASLYAVRKREQKAARQAEKGPPPPRERPRRPAMHQAG